MKVKHLSGFVAAGLIALAATGAMADGTPAVSTKDIPVPVLPYNWTGIYVGAHAGALWGDENWRFTEFGTRISPSFSGPVVGGQLGLQYQFYNNAVFGVELSYTGSGTNYDRHVCPNITLICEGGAKKALQVVGRLGYAWGNFLPYIKGGYANVSLDSNIPAILGDNDSRRQDGWSAGGGVEYAVYDSIIFGIDYSHIEVDSDIHNALNVAGDRRSIDGSLDILTGRISFKLTPPSPAPLK